MEPTHKSYKVNNLLDAILGVSKEDTIRKNNLLDAILGVSKEDTIRKNKCVPAPFGCGGEVTEFRDEISAKEYTISGLCEKCQDRIFGS